MPVTKRRSNRPWLIADSSLLGAHHVRFDRDARADHHFRDRLDHLRPPQAARVGPVAREEPRRIQAGLERAAQHARRRNPARGAETESKPKPNRPRPPRRRPTPCEPHAEEPVGVGTSGKVERARNWPSFPSPAPNPGPPHVRSPRKTMKLPAGRCRFWSISTSSGSASSTALLAVAVGVLVGFFFINRISDFLLGPTRRMLPPGSKMIYTQPGEAFCFNIQIALIAGVVFAAPVIMYQVWLFIAPGLYANEKKLADPVRPAVDDRLRRRRAVQPLRRVRVDDEVLRELQHAGPGCSCRSSTTSSTCIRRCCSAWASSFRCRRSSSSSRR